MSTPPKPILIIEDNEAIRTSLQELFDLEGYLSLSANDGQSGLNLLAEMEPKPFLILLDLNMPHMGGEEFIRRKTELQLAPEAKVVIFAATSTQKRINGVDAWLKKPVEIEEILQLVERYL